MEKDHDKSSPENSPSGGGNGGDDGDTTSKAITDTHDDDAAVSSSFSLAPITTVDITWTLSPQESYGRKRSRGEDHGGGSSSGSGQKGKKKGELIDPPSTDPKCATCGKTFGSWKAVFGHLRSHPEREYRGAFPPPKIWEEMLRQETLRRQHGEGEGSSSGGHAEGTAGLSSLPSGRGIEIDLNDPEEEEANKDEFPFDLNKPAPEDEEEDDK